MTSPRTIVLITSRQRPHELLLLAYSAMLGAFYLTVAPAPASMIAIMPVAAVKVWAGALLLSGVTGMAGCWWRGERGLGVEAGGLLINAGALVLYAAVVFTVGGVRALLPGGVVLAWALANMWRASQAARDIKRIRGKS